MVRGALGDVVPGRGATLADAGATATAGAMGRVGVAPLGGGPPHTLGAIYDTMVGPWC